MYVHESFYPQESEEFDTTTARKLLQANTVDISTNVNLDSSLMAYLVQNDCIQPEDTTLLRGPRSFDNNMKLIEIIRGRGVIGFNGFVKALEEFTSANPAEGAHIELLNRLKISKLTTGSSFQKQDSLISMKSDPCTSLPKMAQKAMSIPEEDEVEVVEKDTTQFTSQNVASTKERATEKESAPPVRI